MEKLKTVLTFMLGGAFLGNMVVTLAAPSIMAWYNSTSLAKETVCNLQQVVEDVTSQFIFAQFIGSGIGAVAFLALGILFIRARAKKQQSTPPPAAPTPTAA
jgi:uncharacterized membrane protein